MEQFLLPADFDFNSFESFLDDPVIGISQDATLSPRQTEPVQFDFALSRQPSRLQSPSPPSGAEHEEERYLVDESSRNDITLQLKPPVPNFDPVLSTEYLNLCLQLYFTSFHPIFPVIHAATFRPKKHNTLLLISICSIGSLFIGSMEAKEQGHLLYSRLNKAILASWERHLSKPKRSSLPMLQAALLGQTFGLLSDKSEDRFMTEAFQGTMLSLARSVGAFNVAEPEEPAATLSGKDLNDVWLRWVHAEELRRLGLALYLHDVEVACLFRHEPYLRHQSVAYHRAVSDEAFAATSAREWRSIYVEQGYNDAAVAQEITLNEWTSAHVTNQPSDAIMRSIETSAFTAYAILANIGACLLERRQPRSRAVEVTDSGLYALRRWYFISTRRSPTDSTDPLCLKILWHHYASSLYADFALLKLALDAGGESPEVALARAWAASDNAPKALFHVCLLYKIALSLPLGLSPPIHLPRAVYAAGVIFTAYWRFSPAIDRSAGNKFDHQSLVSEFVALIIGMPDISDLAQEQYQTPEQFASSVSDLIVRSRSTLPYGCIDLLRKLDRWGVSSVFADTLQTLVRSGLEPC